MNLRGISGNVLGNLEKVTRLIGQAGDLKVTVNGEVYYKTYWRNDNKYFRREYYQKLRNNEGNLVLIEFKEISDPIPEWFADHAFFWWFGSFGFPRKRKEIVKIKYFNKWSI